jgi:hypothetical protein
MLADRVRMCAKSKVEETIEIPFTITVSASLRVVSGGGGGGGGGYVIDSIGQITFNGDEVFVWDVRGLSDVMHVSTFWGNSLKDNFYNETVGIITSTQQEGISNIFLIGFDEGFAVGVYNYFDGIYIYDVPSIVSSGSVTLTEVSNQPNREITVTGVFIV